ncbi:MAG: GTP 3',8-cyclase MoaA [Thermoanaerobacteraceae bacterium]|nr:GTP 3',8-cyclase MoaA [Thermoanaerobacteraceae bacterium]
MRDEFGREIDYLRISITDRCNLRCRYCMPEGGVKWIPKSEILSFEEVLEVCRAASKLGFKKFRLTGGEPLVRLGIIDFIEKMADIEGITDIAMTTNGILLGDMAYELKRAGLKRVNVSLDTLNPEKYHYITRGGNIKRVLDGIEKALYAGLYPIKINTVLIKGFNDDEIDDLINLTSTYPVDVRFIELMPIGEAINMDYISCDQVLNGRELIPLGEDGVASYYRLENAMGRVGLIRPMSCKFCSSCNRLRLTSDGRLKPCLLKDMEVDLKGPLRRGEDIAPVIKKALDIKPKEHEANAGEYLKNRDMYEIGG